MAHGAFLRAAVSRFAPQRMGAVRAALAGLTLPRAARLEETGGGSGGGSSGSGGGGGGGGGGGSYARFRAPTSAPSTAMNGVEAAAAAGAAAAEAILNIKVLLHAASTLPPTAPASSPSGAGAVTADDDVHTAAVPPTPLIPFAELRRVWTTLSHLYTHVTAGTCECCPPCHRHALNPDLCS